jgi:hypothetical protein
LCTDSREEWSSFTITAEPYQEKRLAFLAANVYEHATVLSR